MALNYDKIVKVNVSLIAPAVVPYKYDTGLILGASEIIAPSVRLTRFSSVSEMAQAGFTEQHPEYLAATLYFAQTPAPSHVFVGRIDKTAETNETALAAFKECLESGNEYYGVYVAAGIEAEILELQAWISDQTDFIQFYEDDTDFTTEAPTLITSMKGKHRACGIYNTSANAGAALMGLAMGMGREYADQDFALCYKALNGIATDALTQAKIDIITAANASVYVRRGTRNMVELGAVADGLRYNERMQIDRIASELQEACLHVLADNPTSLPLNDSTSAIFENACNKVLVDAYNRGALSAEPWQGGSYMTLKDGDTLPQGYKVMYDTYSSQTRGDRAMRRAMPLYVAIIMSGSVESVVINVNVQL